MPSDSEKLTVEIRLTRNVQTFHDLQMVADGLQEIDNFATSWIGLVWPSRDFPSEYIWYRRHAHSRTFSSNILKFEVASPPLLVLQTGPEWIAIYLAIAFGGWSAIAGAWSMLATYEDVKHNLHILHKDVQSAIHSVQGLSERARRAISGVISVFFDALLELAETNLQATLAQIRRIQELRAKLALPTEPVQSSIIVSEETKTQESKKL